MYGFSLMISGSQRQWKKCDWNTTWTWWIGKWNMVALLPVKKVEGWNSKRNTQWITGIIPSEIKTFMSKSFRYWGSSILQYSYNDIKMIIEKISFSFKGQNLIAFGEKKKWFQWELFLLGEGQWTLYIVQYIYMYIVQLYSWFVLYTCITFFLLIVLSYVVVVVYATLWKRIAFVSFHHKILNLWVKFQHFHVQLLFAK